jgi:CRISPR-associated protein Cas1
MEPFRPLVDLTAWRLAADGAEELTPEVKGALAAVTTIDMRTARGVTPLATCIERLAQSLAQACESGEPKLDLPSAPLPLDAARLGRE